MDDLLFFVLCMTDGAAWLLGTWYILTGFFGYRVKTAKGQGAMAAGSIVLYALLHTGLRGYMIQQGREFTMVYELMVTAVIGYWMCRPSCCLNGAKKLRIREKLLLAVCALEIISELLILCGWGRGLLTTYIHMPPVAQVLVCSLCNIAAVTGIWWFARLAGRKRKEPMALSLCFLTFLFFMLLDTIVSFVQPTEYTEIEPFVKLRILLSDEELMDQAMGISIFFIVMLICILVIYGIMKQAESMYLQKTNARNEYYLEMQKKHYEGIMESNREIRKIKHDMKNHIYCIEQLRAAKRYDELEEYIREISENLERADITVQTGCEIADAIISERKRKAQGLGIALRVEGELHRLEMSPLHICTIFSNLLDNAMEATQQLTNGEKWIEVKCRKNQHFIFISVTNPVKEPVEIVDNFVKTTKQDAKEHGFGIYNIKEAVAKYEGDVKLSQKEGVFCVELMIPCSH